MLFYCCANFEDGGPPLEQHWVNFSCLIGKSYTAETKDWAIVVPSSRTPAQHYSSIGSMTGARPA